MKRILSLMILSGTLIQPNLQAMNAPAPAQPCKEHVYSRATQFGAATLKMFTGVATAVSGLIVSAKLIENTTDYASGQKPIVDYNGHIIGYNKFNPSIASTSLRFAAAITLPAIVIGSAAFLLNRAYRNEKNAWNYQAYLARKQASCQGKGCYNQ